MDRAAQILLLIFASFAFLVSLAMVLDSAAVVNLKSDLLLFDQKDVEETTEPAYESSNEVQTSLEVSTVDTTDASTDDLHRCIYQTHSVLLCVGLIECKRLIMLRKYN